jgi:hypothetical protein
MQVTKKMNSCEYGSCGLYYKSFTNVNYDRILCLVWSVTWIINYDPMIVIHAPI